MFRVRNILPKLCLNYTKYKVYLLNRLVYDVVVVKHGYEKVIAYIYSYIIFFIWQSTAIHASLSTFFFGEFYRFSPSFADFAGGLSRIGEDKTTVCRASISPSPGCANRTCRTPCSWNSATWTPRPSGCPKAKIRSSRTPFRAACTWWVGSRY